VQLVEDAPDVRLRRQRAQEQPAAASKKATDSVSIKTDATAPSASTVRGVQLQWEAQQR
jgi:hypothetical protein